MCRVFGSVSSDPRTIRHELVEAENPVIRQSQEYDSGWGMAVYPRCMRFPELREPRAERLVGDEVMARADIRKLEEGQGLGGAERGAFAAERAAKLVGAAHE